MADAKGAPDLARARAQAQLLGAPRRRTATEVVRHLLAVQAQDFASAPLALRARSGGLTRQAVHEALACGDLVISWLNRGTLHMVCREDFGWLHALTAPTISTGNRRRLAQEGVSDPEKAVEAIARALTDGPQLRVAIGERVGLAGAALTHALVAATLEGLIVRGPVRGGQQTYVLVRDHLGDAPATDRAAALRELARRFAAAHARATRTDLARWSGLPLRDIPPIESATMEPPGDEPLPPKLLPPFDPYIVDWKDRSFAVAPEMARRVTPGGGMFRAVVLVDGRVAGTWSRAGGRVSIDASADGVPEPDLLEQEIADVERFLA